MILPLIDLHSHIEGTIYPDLLRTMAERNGLAIPGGLIDADGRYAWRNFTEFLNTYDQVAAMIRTEEDYSDIAYDHFRRTALMGQIYGELFLSMDHAAQTGLDYNALIDAVSDGLARAEAEFGITGRFIMTAVRHLGPEQAIQTARLVEKHPHSRVTGFGMGGDERQGEMADFAPAYDIARGTGLGLTVHAGEVCGPDSIEAALEHLKPDRIGHGIRAAQSADLMARLTDRGVTLEVCPGSNIALGLFPSYQQHAFGALQEAGIRIVLGADDPPFFGTDIRREYDEIRRAWQLNRDAMIRISEDAVAAAFCDAQTRSILLQAVRNATTV